MVFFGSVSGYVGWRRSTKPIYRRNYIEISDPPNGLTRREYDRRLRRRRKLWRLVVTAFYALMGALAGVIFLMMVARH
jgi:hypothetical protein